MSEVQGGRDSKGSGRRPGRPSAGDAAVPSTEAILDAALVAFAARGYEATSVRELSRSLGISHNLIPQRIGSKEVLWFAAVDRGFGFLAAALTEPDVEAHEDDLDRLRAQVVRFIEANARRPALLRVIAQEAVADGPRLDHLFRHYIDPVREVGEAVLARLEAAGRVRSGSVGLLYFLMTHGAGGPMALPGLARRFGEVVDPDDPEAVHRHAVAAADVLFEGLVLPHN